MVWQRCKNDVARTNEQILINAKHNACAVGMGVEVGMLCSALVVDQRNAMRQRAALEECEGGGND